MIKKFKIFERYNSSIEDELIDELDSSKVEEYYDDNYNIDVSELISMSSTRTLLDAFDDEKFKDDFISDYKNNYELSELSDYDLKSYIENHMTTKKENKILELYNSNNYDEDKDINSEIDGTISFEKSKKDKVIIVVTSKTGEVKKYKVPRNNKVIVENGEYVTEDELLSTEKEQFYEDYMLDELSEDDLKDVIEDSDEEYECVEETIDGWYSGETGEDIIESMYGRIDRMEPSELYKYIENYIDDDKLIENWKEGEDYEYKKEFVKEYIEREPDLQRNILGNSPSMVLKLAELFEGSTSSNNIGDEYNFQKAYIEQYAIENADEDDPEDIKDKKEDAVLYLDDEYGLDDDIRKEYEDYMLKVTMKKYNL